MSSSWSRASVVDVLCGGRKFKGFKDRGVGEVVCCEEVF